MNNKLTWMHVALISVLIVAGVITAILPNSEKTLIIVVTAVLAAYVGPAAANKQQQETLSEIAEKTTQVQKQTNGVLDQRIRDAVRDVLEERDRTLGKPIREKLEEGSGNGLVD